MTGLPAVPGPVKRDPAGTSGVLVVVSVVALVFGITTSVLWIYVAFALSFVAAIFLLVAVRARNARPSESEEHDDLEEMLEPRPLDIPKHPLPPGQVYTYVPLPVIPESVPVAEVMLAALLNPPTPAEPEPTTVPMAAVPVPPAPPAPVPAVPVPAPAAQVETIPTQLSGRRVQVDSRTHTYHRPDCGILGDSSYELTQVLAIRSGYMSCMHCRA